jgi:nicotinamidase-related amidase
MKTALIIIDIQNDYFENGTMTLAGSLEASHNAASILGLFRSIDEPIIFIQHIALSPTATFFLPGTQGAEIHQSVEPKDSEKVIVKHYPNSFRETELLEYLNSLDITDLVICGMMTQMCVDATTRAAKDYGFNCTLIGDACATKDLEINGRSVKAADVQTSFLAALNGFYSQVILTSQLKVEKNQSGVESVYFDVSLFFGKK